MKSKHDKANKTYERLRKTWIQTYCDNYQIDESYGSLEIKKWSDKDVEYHGQIIKDSNNIMNGRVCTVN